MRECNEVFYTKTYTKRLPTRECLLGGALSLTDGEAGIGYNFLGPALHKTFKPAIFRYFFVFQKLFHRMIQF